MLTTEPSCCKNLYVPDTSALLFSAQVELKGKNIFEWLLDRHNVYICSEVKYECFDIIQKDRVDLYNPQKVKRYISKNEMPNRDYSDCLGYLKKYCVENELRKFLKLGSGEKNSVALSLYLSIKYDKPIILLIDDYGAEKTIASLLEERKFAIVKAVPDLIINLFQTNYDLNENQVRGALQSYYNIRRYAVVNDVFKKRMKFNCRSFWFEECGLKCC